MESQKTETISCYAYNYKGHYEGCFTLAEGADLPKGFTLIAPPFSCPFGFIQTFIEEDGRWVFSKEYVHPPLLPDENGEFPSVEEVQKREKDLIDSGVIPDQSRVQKDFYEKRMSLRESNESVMAEKGIITQ